MYDIPRYKIQLVKENTILAEIKRINRPQEIANIFVKYLEGTDRENFIVALLDTKNGIIGINTVAIGSLNAAVVHPREVFKPAILVNAAAIIIGHNHPSGNVNPSNEDITLTNRINEAGKILGIPVIDHIIVSADGESYSFKAACRI